MQLLVRSGEADRPAARVHGGHHLHAEGRIRGLAEGGRRTNRGGSRAKGMERPEPEAEEPGRVRPAEVEVGLVVGSGGASLPGRPSAHLLPCGWNEKKNLGRA